MSVWYKKYSSFRSGTARPWTRFFLPRFILIQVRSFFSHSSGISESTLILARTSSPLLVS